MNDHFKYLVYDIESVINKPLLNMVLYPGKALSDDEACRLHVEELAKENKDFVNPSFHKPVTIAVAAVAEDFSLTKIGLLGDEEHQVRSMVEAFWDIYADKRPTFVDFHGKGYDLRLLELWAFQLGLSIHPKYFSQYGPRYRFSSEHIDLNEFLNNARAISWKGGLNLFAKLLGKPGKMETTGDQVQGLYEAGKLFEIDDYCLSDVMDTYFVFLRTRVIKSELTLEKEQELVGRAKSKMEEMAKEKGYFRNYLTNFGAWQTG